MSSNNLKLLNPPQLDPADPPKRFSSSGYGEGGYCSVTLARLGAKVSFVGKG